jgi:hypothetical protein
VTGLVRSAIVLLFPRTDGLPGADDCDLDAFLERFRRESSPVLWLGVVAGALLFHLSPVFTVHVPLPATLLSPATADRHALRIAETRVYLARQLIFLVKFVAGMAWGSDATVRGALALPPMPEDPGTWRRT